MGNEVAEQGMINDQQKWLVKQQTRGIEPANRTEVLQILSKDNMILKCHFSTRSGVDQQASIHVLFGTVYGLRFKGLPVGNQMGWSSPTCNWQVVICTFSFCHDLPCVNIYIYIYIYRERERVNIVLWPVFVDVHPRVRLDNEMTSVRQRPKVIINGSAEELALAKLQRQVEDVAQRTHHKPWLASVF